MYENLLYYVYTCCYAKKKFKLKINELQNVYIIRSGRNIAIKKWENIYIFQN